MSIDTTFNSSPEDEDQDKNHVTVIIHQSYPALDKEEPIVDSPSVMPGTSNDEITASEGRHNCRV